MFLTACAADGFLLQDLFLALEEIVGNEHFLDLLNAETFHRGTKAFPGFSLALEEKDSLLNNVCLLYTSRCV